jgi:6-phosphogluconate dehydrogenase
MEEKIGLVGLGKMGKNIVFNLLDNGYKVVALNRSPGPLNEVAEKGAEKASSMEDMIEKLGKRKVIWVMLPAGEVTNNSIEQLSKLMNKGDIIIDGSNSNFNNSIKLHEILSSKGILHLDAGCSGGPYGARHGMCIMVGGDKEAYDYVEDVLKKVSVLNGCLYTGSTGSGHFVKMVHNAIEYGMMQSIAEGIELVSNEGPYKNLNLEEICTLWNNGSVIRSYLVGLAGKAIKNNGKELSGIMPYVDDTGEGRWAIQTAIDYNIPFTAITESLYERFRSRSSNHFSMRMLAALRHEFGGHEVKKENAEN